MADGGEQERPTPGYRAGADDRVVAQSEALTGSMFRSGSQRRTFAKGVVHAIRTDLEGSEQMTALCGHRVRWLFLDYLFVTYPTGVGQEVTQCPACLQLAGGSQLP